MLHTLISIQAIILNAYGINLLTKKKIEKKIVILYSFYPCVFFAFLDLFFRIGIGMRSSPLRSKGHWELLQLHGGYAIVLVRFIAEFDTQIPPIKQAQDVTDDEIRKEKKKSID